MNGEQIVHALALRLDPAWRRLPAEERRDSVVALDNLLKEAGDVRTFTYSSVGLQPGMDILIWSLGPSLEAIEERAAAILRTGLGAWTLVGESLIGIIRPSQYVKKPTAQEQSLFAGERAKYLIVYPFTKNTDWYLQDAATRQTVMNEHMKIGHKYQQVSQLLAYSFGIDDMDFIVAYETDDLTAFMELVRELRATESRRSTVRDTPILTAVHRPIGDIGRLLGA